METSTLFCSDSPSVPSKDLRIKAYPAWTIAFNGRELLDSSKWSHLTRAIDEYLMAMGIRLVDRKWAMTTTYKPTASKGKQADLNLTYLSLCSHFALTYGPISRGSKAHHLFRGSAKIPNGGSITPVEKFGWCQQLASPNSPRPLTRVYIDSLRRRHLPPLIQQAAGTQQMYSHHEVDVTSSGVAGTPRV
ncbi:hypothetical protein N7486_006212 [Penicillium sp. IBT 16267x]|nr:hypothetical protein N7486_006212 [Penicillium sp. IBT 16267x]